MRSNGVTPPPGSLCKQFRAVFIIVTGKDDDNDKALKCSIVMMVFSQDTQQPHYATIKMFCLFSISFESEIIKSCYNMDHLVNSQAQTMSDNIYYATLIDD
jgi:hypothetical protein